MLIFVHDRKRVVWSSERERGESESDMHGCGESVGSLVGPPGVGQWSAQQPGGVEVKPPHWGYFHRQMYLRLHSCRANLDRLPVIYTVVS